MTDKSAKQANVKCPICDLMLKYPRGALYINCPSCRRTLQLKVKRPSTKSKQAGYSEDVSKSIKVMRQGKHFSKVEDDGTLTDVFVHLNPGPAHDLKASSLYWGPPDSRDLNPEKCLTLKSITEMLQGLPKKLSNHPIASQLPKNQCFTLFAGKDKSITMKTSDKNECVQWLTTLHSIIMASPSSSPTSDSSSSHASSGSTTPPAPPSAPTTPRSQLKPRRLAPEETTRIIQAMKNGEAFTLHNVDQPTKQVNVFYTAETQYLYWDTPGSRTQHASQCLPLRTVSDIFVGKRAKAFASSGDVANEHCFSLVSKSLTLNLQAADLRQAGDWLSAIHSILTRPCRSRRSSKPGSGSDAAEKADPLQKILRLMRQGNNFVRYLEGNAIDKLFLFYSDNNDPLQIGELCWCKQGEKMENAKHKFSLNKMKEMTIGKQTPIFKSPEAAGADKHRCFSLIGSELTLNLEAESRGKLAVWLNGIHKILTQQKRMVSQKSTDNKENQRTQGSQNVPYNLLAACPVFTKYEKSTALNSMGNVVGQTSRVMVWYEPAADNKLGSLYWCPETQTKKKVATKKNSLSLSSITEMCLGKQTDAFRTEIGKKAETARCFSLFSGSVPIDLEANTAKERTTWLNEVHRLLTQSGGMRPKKIPSRARQGGATADANSQSDAASHAIQLMVRGAVFDLYDLDLNGSNGTITEVFLFYKVASTSTGVGALYWCDPSKPRSESSNRTLALDDIVELTSGKQTKTFQSRIGKKAEETKCFTLRTSTMELNLEAESREKRGLWLRAIHKVLTDVMNKEPKKRSDSTSSASSSGSEGYSSASSSSSNSQFGSIPDHRPQVRKGPAPTLSKNKNIDPESIYKVIAKIGQGSYGSVYRAMDRRDSTIVGLKLLDFDADSMEDIQKEIDILKNCQSQHIVALKGVYRKGKTIWIAMEFCAAGSLSDMMTICQKTPEEKQIQAIMKMSLEGLKYLHSVNIIHRDIKAANILVNDNGECKLADFGVSAEIATTLSRKQTVIGTPNWMAPEVIKASAYDEKADIWSLGITAIELAVGQPPHSDVHPMTAMFKIPTSPSPTLPYPERWTRGFHSFVNQCLQKDLSRRPSANQLLDHPWIKAAPSATEIVSFVDECMVEMSSYRALEDANKDSAGESKEEAVVGSTMAYS